MPLEETNSEDQSVIAEEQIDAGEDEPQADAQPTLEEKYKDQMRQIMPQKIELPISTLLAMIEAQINLNPNFQRRDRWPRPHQSRFIESIIMNVPIPPVFLGEDEYGSYVVLDGRQRLTAVSEFLKNNYSLEKLQVWSELNGKTFNDLKKLKLDKFFTRRFIPAIVILKESSPEVKFDVFERLNTGAVVAVPMEIRNAVFQGAFNVQLHKLSDEQIFRRLWGIPTDDIEREKNQTFKTMGDVELVLRFFALREYQSMNLRYKDYLSSFMSGRNAAYKAQPALKDADIQAFMTAVGNCWKVFNDAAFRRPTTGHLSAPLADAYMVALSEITPQVLDDASKRERVRERLNRLATEDLDFQKAFGTGTNGKGAISLRIEKAKKAVNEALA
jgi:hypothetical protein